MHGFHHKDVITNVEENYTWMMKGSTYNSTTLMKMIKSIQLDTWMKLDHMDQIILMD
jgi:hypothetical protein